MVASLLFAPSKFPASRNFSPLCFFAHHADGVILLRKPRGLLNSFHFFVSLNFYFNFLLQLPLPCSLFHIHTAPSPMLRGRFPCVSPLKIFACSRKILSLRKPRGSLNSFHFTFSLNFYFNYLLQFPLPCSLLVVSLSNHSLFILPL